ncbi:hypothetical protein LMG28614_05977 [Paraburkholderia ultramafica]|uniref:Uncharacterized protein n=1 Tax=Paraburkholderia ultramafica TaxID=1544867 RepID=A0A6S7D2A6_9BURK|nr:hypothetical protein [Paraburkholderia ultramafica]CAB3804199.1 hypothetical protein LMG28614_05977 [Paraburkholderia ultramafica]
MQKRCYVVSDSTVAEHVAEYLGIAKRLNGAYRLKNGDTVTHLNRVPRGGVPVDLWRDMPSPYGRFFDRTPERPDDKDEQRNLVGRLLREADIVVNACGARDIDQYLADKLIADAGFDPAGRKTIAGRSKPVERVVFRALDCHGSA